MAISYVAITINSIVVSASEKNILNSICINAVNQIGVLLCQKSCSLVFL